ncbi:translation initiation factor eIF-2B subunit epsilon-like protein [Leptotrombidium deliense]|uniref:Translation initiation factor eIF2B subunit epsilon n=1 Tax=Leptotrombidium deliense TaxID=299467 RepID=A0A443SI85_9ACAR|nr:translation initiation factor eIF-2B subunit epsilon-like protein [Leptotrombidium deliense]
MSEHSSARKKGIEEKQVLQAILICDSFNSCFQPLTANIPRALLPLINRPILEILAKTDKNAVMTLLYKRSSTDRIFRTGDEEVMIIADGTTNRLLQYEKVPKSQKKMEVSVGLLREHRNAKVHFNLQDTHIAICSVNVLSLFSDNFDYETKDDFIRGILEQEEILGNTIYVKICNSKTYSSRIINVCAYDVICREILQRWAFPIVPDVQSKFCYQRHNIYKYDNVMLSMDSTAVKNVAIGSDTVIGENAFIVNSVIGSKCKIGKNVVIDGSYIWDNVVIGDDCIVKSCIISHNVILKNSCQLSDGCLIAENVILGPNIELKTEYIQSEPNDESETVNIELVGKEGKGFKYEEEDNEENDLTFEIWGAEKHRTFDEISLSSANSHDLESIEEELDEVCTFYKEVLDSCQRAFDENVATENLILEVNSSKHAYNIPIKELAFLVSRAIFDLPAIQKKSNPGVEYGSQLMSVFKRFLPFIKNYIKSSESELCLLSAMEEFAITNPSLFTSVLLAKSLGYLYNNDVLNEETLFNWYKSLNPIPALLNEEECSPADQQKLRNSDGVKKFFKWLQEAEEESD